MARACLHHCTHAHTKSEIARAHLQHCSHAQSSKWLWHNIHYNVQTHTHTHNSRWLWREVMVHHQCWRQRIWRSRSQTRCSWVLLGRSTSRSSLCATCWSPRHGAYQSGLQRVPTVSCVERSMTILGCLNHSTCFTQVLLIMSSPSLVSFEEQVFTTTQWVLFSFNQLLR